MKFIGIIPARFKSSRFPGKPLAQICGRPMIWWVYRQAYQVEELDEIYVATDDDRIAQECRRWDIPVLMTSKEHETGSDRVAEAARITDGDVYINIQGDEPTIEPEMIREVMRIFGDGEVLFATLKREITDEEEMRAPSTVKVVTDEKGNALYFSRSPIPSNLKGKDRASIFRLVGIYGYRREFLLRFAELPPSELEIGEGIEPLRALERGYPIRVAETKYDSIDVDLPEHIEKAEQFIREKEGKE